MRARGHCLGKAPFRAGLEGGGGEVEGWLRPFRPDDKAGRVAGGETA